ncbi:hypothetical protein SASPL_133486 [Salvia splendens]|uniref:Uncharacterized protein n=1 Tax=Salvia splendens TaxID=180675 RepID=A0A8X8X3W1_SALSN|nr:hypothetical protein SASPL_133486 [Salvia splendens]
MSEFIKSSPIKELAFFSFLRNFRELRLISLDFTCPGSICSSSLWKVMVKFRSGGAMVELFLKLQDYVPGEVSSSDDEDADDALTDTGIVTTHSLSLDVAVFVVNHGTLDKLDPDSGTLDGGDIVTWDEKDMREPLMEFLGLAEVTVGEDVHHHGPSGVDVSELDLIAGLATCCFDMATMELSFAFFC